jgi:hypothetical protein
MSLLISVAVITAILVVSPSATISALSLCCLLSFAYMSGAIQFNLPTELSAIPTPGPQPETERQQRLISWLVRSLGRESDDNCVQGELTRRSKYQSPGVTLALGPSLWRRATSSPPAAGYPIQILYDCEGADLEYVSIIQTKLLPSDNHSSIVAVHGLAANPDYAWVWQPRNNPVGISGYPQQHYNWLKELLPIKLSSAGISCRVMTFNYDSRWFMNAPQQRLSNISDSLLDSLRNKRGKVSPMGLIHF